MSRSRRLTMLCWGVCEFNIHTPNLFRLKCFGRFYMVANRSILSIPEVIIQSIYWPILNVSHLTWTGKENNFTNRNAEIAEPALIKLYNSLNNQNLKRPTGRYVNNAWNLFKILQNQIDKLVNKTRKSRFSKTSNISDRTVWNFILKTILRLSANSICFVLDGMTCWH